MQSRAKRRASHDDIVTKVYEILSNPYRRKIIELLGEKGKASFSELKRHLGASVGTIYYNLDSMREYIEQDVDKKYMLNSTGWKIYEIIKEESERIMEFFRPKHKIEVIFDKYIRKIVLPESIFLKMYKNYVTSIIFSIIALILGITGCFIADLDLTLFEYNDVYGRSYFEIFNIHIPVKLWIALKIIISWLVITLLSELLSRIFGSKIFRAEFSIVMLIALLPLFIYPFIYIIFVKTGLIETLMGLVIVGLLFRLLQLFSIGFLTTTIHIYRGLKTERAFIIVFVIFYISFILNYYYM